MKFVDDISIPKLHDSLHQAVHPKGGIWMNGGVFVFYKILFGDK